MTDNLNFTPQPELPDQDAELLSAYIDGMLTEDERRLLEQRLQDEPQLARELGALQQTVNWINQLPVYKAPRDFTITPADVRPIQQTKSNPNNILSLNNASWWLYSAAAVVVVLIGVMIVLPQLTNTTTMTESAGDIAQSAPEVAAQPSEMPTVADVDIATRSEQPTSPEALSAPPQGVGASAEDETSGQAFSSTSASSDDAPSDSAANVTTTEIEVDGVADEPEASALADTTAAEPDVTTDDDEIETIDTTEEDAESDFAEAESLDVGAADAVEMDMDSDADDMGDVDMAGAGTGDETAAESRLLESQSQLPDIISIVQDIFQLLQALQRAIQP